MLRRPIVSVALRAASAIKGRKTVADRLVQYEGPVRERLAERFRVSGVAYPPRELALIGLKEERILEVWAKATTGIFRHVKSYPILGASGKLGPKLAEGDLQVPEGFYRVESLNPNSAFHLALRVSYPNEFDRQKGALDGRDDLGSDIMIHGSTASIGCLAMGDAAAEELFVLAAVTGIENVSILLSPVDFRRRDLPREVRGLPAWSSELYADIRKAMMVFIEQNGRP